MQIDRVSIYQMIGILKEFISEYALHKSGSGSPPNSHNPLEDL